jgi:Helix-turn-helix domain
MSIKAMTWALREAPDVPASCVAILIGLSAHVDDNGRNAYPSESTLAEYTRKTVRQVRRDLRELERLGLIRRGDQSAVSRLPPQYRPTVYDVALDRTSVSALERTSTSGLERTPVSAPDRTPMAARPDTHVRLDRTPMSAKSSLNRPGTVLSARASADAVATVVHALRDRTGKTIGEDHAALVVRQLLDGRPGIRDHCRYLAGAIRNDADPHRFLPTPMPPRFQRDAS